MEKIGVEAIVSGLTSFLGNMDKMDSKIKGLVPGGNLLSRTFDGIKEAVLGFGREVLNVAEYALGQLLADAIRGIISALSDLISRTFEAANELQTLSIRLDGLNLPTGKIDDYSAAMENASAMTADQLDWLQQLAVVAPFSAQDIADVYTMARAMGYADDAARVLTKDIFEFVAGMGLAADAADHVILNLFQMTTRGKVTGREMSDLARGSLVPLADILQRMADEMGISVEELNKLISTAEGVDPDIFIRAFQAMVEEEPRFAGAMGRLGRSFQAATTNFSQLIESLGAKNIIMPILDILGEKIATITDQFITFNEQGDMIKTDKWWDLVDAATRIGVAIGDIVTGLFGLAPTSESIADGMVTSFEMVATWLEDNKDGIIKWVQDSAEKIGEFVTKVEGYVEKIEKAWDKLSTWVTNNKPLIDEFFETLGEIVSTVFEDLLGDKEIKLDVSGVLKNIKELMKWVIKNKDAIAEWIEKIIKVGAFLLALGVIVGIIWTIFVTVFTAIATIVLFALGIIGLFSSGVGVAVVVVVGVIGVLAAFVTSAVIGFIAGFLGMGESVRTWAADTVTSIQNWAADTSIMTWTANTQASISAWSDDTLKSINTWSDNTLKSIKTWAGDDSIITWTINTLNAIFQWAIDTSGSFSTWASDNQGTITTWSGSTTGIITSWAGDTLGTFVTWGLDVLESFKTSIADWIDYVKGKFSTMQKLGHDLAAKFGNGIIDKLRSMLAEIYSLIQEIVDAVAELAGLDVGGGGSGGSGGGGSGGGGGCFIAGTMILMGDKSHKAIEEIAVGDEVTSFDTEHQSLLTAKIIHIFHHLDCPNPFYLLVNGHLGVTPNHPVFVNQEWKLAKTLCVGDKMLNEKGETAVVRSVERINRAVPVFNLHTDNSAHNYFAGGLLAHNVEKLAGGTNGWQTVPPGFNQDDYNLGLTSGEQYMVIPKSGAVSSAMTGQVVNTSSQVHNEYTLNIASSANTEPIIQDFGMLESLQP